MGDEKEKCVVCCTEYKKTDWGVCDDSHMTYTTRIPCPKCGYNEALEKEIEKILNEKTVLSCRPGGKMQVNTEELTKYIVKAVRTKWSEREPVSTLN